MKMREPPHTRNRCYEQASDFIYALTIKPGVEDALPFYYKKLEVLMFSIYKK